MNGFVKEILIPSVEQSMPVDIIPSEVMRRLSTGISASELNSNKKPLRGRLGVLNFEIYVPSRGRELSVTTTGVIVPEKNVIELKTAPDSREFVLILSMLFIGLAFFTARDFSSKGVEAVEMSGIIFLMVSVMFYGVGWMSAKAYAQRHYQFIRDTIASPSGFDWVQHQKKKVLDFWIYFMIAVATIVLIVFWAKAYFGL